MTMLLQLTITKKATQSAAPNSVPVSKKVQARIVHDDEEDEQDQASAVADEGVNGQEKAKKVKEFLSQSGMMSAAQSALMFLLDAVLFNFPPNDI